MAPYRQTTGRIANRSDQRERCRAAAVVRAAVAGEGVDASTRMNALASLGSSISVANRFVDEVVQGSRAVSAGEGAVGWEPLDNRVGSVLASQHEPGDPW